MVKNNKRIEKNLLMNEQNQTTRAISEPLIESLVMAVEFAIIKKSNKKQNYAENFK